MLLHHLRCFVGEFLQVRIGAVLRFGLEFGQIFFVIFDHHVHVILVRFPLPGCFRGWERDAFFLRQRHQLAIGLGMVGHHTIAELFDIGILSMLRGQFPRFHLHHAAFRGIHHEGLVLVAEFAGSLSRARVFLGRTLRVVVRALGAFQRRHVDRFRGQSETERAQCDDWYYDEFIFHRLFWLASVMPTVPAFEDWYLDICLDVNASQDFNSNHEIDNYDHAGAAPFLYELSTRSATSL